MLSHFPQGDDPLSSKPVSTVLPRAWIGYIVAITVLMIWMCEVVILVALGFEADEVDIGPAALPALIALGGWIYWLFCVYRMHQVIAEASKSSHPITPGKAVGYHFIPFYNLYWVFKWPNEIASFVNGRWSSKQMAKGWAGLFLLVGSLLGSRVHSVIDSTIGLAIVFSVGVYLTHKISHAIESSPSSAEERITSDVQPAPAWPHSGFGIASFVISLVMAVVEFFLAVIAEVLVAITSSDIIEAFPVDVVLGIFMCGGLLASLVGATFGIIGVVQKERRRLFPILGTAFSIMVAPLALLPTIIGRPLNCEVLNREGLTLYRQVQYPEALEKFQTALVCYQGALVGDRSGEGGSLNGIGLVYVAQGHYDEALESHQQALAIQQELGERIAEGVTLNNIGNVYLAQGRYDEALENFQQVLVIQREEDDRAEEGVVLNNIGGAYYLQGRYGKALAYFQQALTIHQEMGDRVEEGSTLNNIGNVYLAQGRYAEALESFQQALAIVREVGYRVGEGSTLNNIGGVYEAQGRYAEALEICQQALVIVREVGYRVGEGVLVYNIGAVYQAWGDDAEALAHYQRAMDILEAVRAEAGSEQGRAGFIAQYADLYARAATLFHQQGQHEEAFFTSERGRARAFLDSLATGQVALTDNEAVALVEWQEAYADCQAAQDALVRARALDPSTGSGQAPPDPSLVADLEAQLAEAEAAYAKALAAVEARGDQLAALVPGRSTILGLPDIQALLDEETTLLSYFVLEDQTLAFLITRSSFETMVIEVSRQELINRVSYFRDVIPFRKLETTQPAARELYQLLIAPLIPSLHTPRLAIVPHGPLHYLPFAALVDPDTGKILLERYALITLPSASALSFILENAEEQRSRGAGEQGEGLSPTRPYPHTYTLILGNPATGDTDLEPLLFAEREAQAIADLYQAQPLLGEAATESAIREQASQASILHLAAHGGYNPHNPLYSAITLAPDAETDGRLEVHEIYGLDLAKTDLVVLSACQTQLGELSAGDELVGLTRAFFFAGAPTVIATLWSVDDEATGLLMERFYVHLREGMDKATALRQAQLEVREAYPDPYYWAGFVLSGDGGDVSENEILAPTPVVTSTVDQAPQETPVPPSEPGPPNPPRWAWLMVGGVLLVVVAVGAVVGWRRASWTNAQPHPRDCRPHPEHRNEFRHPS